MNNQSNQNGNQPGGLPLFVSGWGAGNINFGGGAAFWDEISRVTSEGLLADHLDSAMTGHSSPRVWLFLHEPGESHLSVAAALAFARELAHRDQAVLLLDGDDENGELTEWADRKDADGWIDLVRYGASVLTSGTPMPFEGRRGYLLGVGSFTPAEVTAPEVKDLLARLKRQADDILVVAPTGTVGRLWAAETDIRLLCWDRAQRSASLVEDLLENFSTAELALTGMIGFGLPQEPAEVDHRHDLDEMEEMDGIPVGVVDEAFVKEATGVAAAVLTEMEEDPAEVDLEEEEFARRKGNSRVFWIAAVVALLLIGAASIYYMKFMRVPANGYFPATTQQDVAQGGEAVFDSGAALIKEETVVDVQDNEPEQPKEEEVALDLPVKEDLPADPMSTDPDPLMPSDEMAENFIPPAADVSEEMLVIDGFAMGPYMTAVGGNGWALHVFSFPDSLRAEQERKILAAKGFQTSTRVIQFKEKGRWFRLYLGNFKTKAEANAARRDLMDKLGEDWANPVRF